MSAIRPKVNVDVEAMFPGIEEIVVGEKSAMKVVRNQEAVELPKRVVIFQDSGVPRSTEEWLSDLDSSLKDFYAKRVLAQYRQFTSSGLQWESGADNEAVYIAYLSWFTRQMQSSFQATNPRQALATLKKTLETVLETGIKVMKPSHGTPGHGNVAAIVRNQFLRRDEHLEKRKYNEMLAHLLILHRDLVSQIAEGPEENVKLMWKAAFKLITTIVTTDQSETITINIDCFDFVSPFGFEMHSLHYLQSFILTPTSERRLLHVFLTMKHSLSCMLSGTPGSEKTETLKHLALLCGRLLQLCFITSTTVQEKVVKFIVGCALGGYWGCIDEIQSLPEVSLCTMLHYIRVISASAVPSPPRVTIDSYQVKPRIGFAMFSTSSIQNPELPRSFHEQFRTLAVSKPDLSTIASILLQTYGFEKANKYGTMIAKAMELLELPMLSFSTGATLNLFAKANTRTLVRLIRSMIDIAMKHYINDMQYLVNNAFRQVYGLGLLAKDLEILDEYLSTLFQSTHNDIVAQIKSRSISEQILQVISQEKLAAEEAMQRRCQHLWWLLFGSRRPWVFLVGQPLSGKSAIVKILAKVIASLRGVNFKVHKLGAAASAAALPEMYEYLANSTNPWFSSTLTTNFHSETALPGEAINSPIDWVHVDSYSYPYTADTLFTLMKTYPKAEVSLIFESERLDSASPSIIYEAGVLYVEDEEIDDFAYYKIRMQQILLPSLRKYLPLLERLYTIVLAPVIAYVSINGVTIKLSNKMLIQQFSNVLNAYFALLRNKIQNEQETKAIPLTKEANSLLYLKRTTHIMQERKGPQLRNKSIVKNPDLKTNVLRYLGSVRKTVSHINPEMCIEAIFVVSTLHALGRLTVNKDSFSSMMTNLLLRQTEDFAYYLQREMRDAGGNALLDLVFSLKSLSWKKVTVVGHLDEDYSKVKPAVRAQPELAPSLYDSAGVQLNIFDVDIARSYLLISTDSSRRLSYWVEFCLNQNLDILVIGPHQCGKSLVTMSIAKDMLSRSASALIPFNVSEFSSAIAVQESIQMSMEHYRRYSYGGLGGMKYYAVLDDMNMDASYQLYDLLRFWKETKGWYGKDFVTVQDLTVALVHSFTEGKSRPLWLRAVRYFFLVHKEEYLDTEVASIFRQFVDSDVFEETDAPRQMRTVVEDSLISLVNLFHQLNLLHKSSEQIWCHVSISNFVLALRFLSQFDLSEEISVATYLKLWTFMYTRFFQDQFGDPSSSPISRELQSAVSDNISNLIEKFVDTPELMQEINEEGFMMPAESELTEPSSGLFHEFELMNEDNISQVVTQFHISHQACVKLYPQLLKWLHSLIFEIEERFSVFYYMFLSLMYDIKGSCSSIIIKSQSQVSLIKALVYIAAETLKVKIVDFSIGESDDSFSEHMIESFRVVSPHHIPTEVRYAVKHIIEQAMIQDKRTVILITFVDAKQLDRPLSHRIMEICNDIMTGVQLRLTGFAGIYREFVDKYRSSSEDQLLKGEHYNEQILQMMLDRMRMNTTIVFLIESENESWIRSPLHPIGILEKFKHEHRAIFNKSRIVDFDQLNPPKAFVKHLTQNSMLFQAWKLDFHNELLLAIGDKVAKLLKEQMLEEFTYECVIYCSSKMINGIKERRRTAIATYKQALQQIELLEKTIEFAPSQILVLEEETKKQELHLVQLREKKVRLESTFAKELAYDYSSEFQESVHQNRLVALKAFTEVKETWLSDLSTFEYKLEDVREVEKVLSVPAIARALFLFQVLVNPPDPALGIAMDGAEAVVKKLMPHLAKKPKETGKKLKKLEPEFIPNLRSHMESLELGSISKVPKLIRAMFAVLVSSQNLREAYYRMAEETARIDEVAASIPKLVESKLDEKKASQVVRLARIQDKINNATESLAAIAKEMEQIALSRPKLQKFIADLRLLSDSWVDMLAVNELNTELGDCILSSFLLLKGMSLTQEARSMMIKTVIDVLKQYNYECQMTPGLTQRLISNHRTFSYECVRRGLPDSIFFKDNIAALQTIIRLNLPFPIFYDPYEIAAEYVIKTETENGLLVGKVSNDISFERKLRECIIEGKPVLCMDPSHSLFKVITPILSWKSQFFVALMRGVDTSGLTFSSSKGPIVVHPNFRLYIACRELPSADILQLTTIINFDAFDKESWEAYTFLPLLKLLDEHQHQVYGIYLVKQHEQALAVEEAESEILSLLNQNDMRKLISSETLLEAMFKAWRKMRSLPMMSEEEGSGRGRRASLTLKEKSQNDIRIGTVIVDMKMTPREKMKRLLSEMFDFKQTLNICNTALKDYAVPEKLLHMTITNSVIEYIRTIAIPLESQWEGFAECMAYRVFVRISHSLPKEKRLTFAAFYTFYKHYLTGSVGRTEYLEALKDIARVSGRLERRQENVDYLIEKYPQLFSSHFVPGTSSFNYFLTRDLYYDAKLPETIPPIYRYLLYSYMRPDLLSDFISHIAQVVLGPRFSWVPQIHLDIYTNDTNKVPTVIFFDKTSPMPLLRYMAEDRKLTLVATQPLIESVMKTGRTEIKKVGRATNPILSTLRDSFGSSRWVTIENLHSIVGLEAEVLTKFLLYKTPEEAGDNLRIWLIFQGKPEQHPQWTNLLKQCQRIVMPEPVSIREEMFMWHYTNNGEFYIHYREFVNKRYWSHCALEGNRSPQAKGRHITSKSRERMTNFINQNPELVQVAYPETADAKAEMAFNIALLFSVLHFRNRHHLDLPNLWERGDARRLVDDYLVCLPEGIQPTDILTPSNLRLFCHLLAPQFDSYSIATIVGLLKHIFQSDRGVLTVKPREESALFTAIEYPLYASEHSRPNSNLEIILNRYPIEDHLLVSGLKHYHAVPHRLVEAKDLLDNVWTLYNALEGEVQIDYFSSLATAKSLVSESLQQFLNEILSAMPIEVHVKTLTREHVYANAFTKSGNSFKAALAHTQDGFKLSDMRNSVLNSPPSLKEVLEVLEVAEAQMTSWFLSSVRTPLVEMNQYLAYARSTISKRDMSDLADLARNNIPQRWLDLGPYVCRGAKNVDAWKKQIVAFFAKKIDWSAIDLTALFDPSLALHSILRASSVTTGQHFHKLGFSMQFSTDTVCDASKYQINVTGLYMANGRVNVDTGVLMDSPVGENLPRSVLMPIKLPKSVRSSTVYPEGLKLLVCAQGETAAKQKPDLSGVVNSLLRGRPGAQQAASDPNYVFVPVELSSPPLWLLVPGSETESHWSKKGTLVRLRES